MYLLQTLPGFSDEVVVSSLPHPISMFLLGIMIVTVIYVVIDHRKMRDEVRAFREDIRDITETLGSVSKSTDQKIQELSKKVDSRVDKAILAIKKAGDQNR
jgi:hypothetical protein